MITLLQNPQKFSPSGNPIIFQVNSNTDVLYFKVELKQADTNLVVSSFDLTPTPDVPKGSYVDLSKHLSNVVDYQISNTQNSLSVPMSKSVFKYKLEVTEKLLVANEVEDGDTLTTDDFYVWEAQFNSFEFSEFNYSDYVISTGLPVKFLTAKPDKSVVNAYSAEMLYFLHETEDNLFVMVKTFNSQNQQLNSYNHTITDLAQNNLFRLQVSPKSLKETLLIDFTGVTHYTVYLVDENGDKRTQTRTFLYRDLPCHLEPTNMLWSNSFGGFDAYQFVNVQESNQLTKNTFKSNTYKIDNGLYSNRTDDIWNAPEQTINIGQQGTYQGYSKVINDAESRWFNELFTSKKVYVELTNNSLVPVMIDANNYNIQKQKYTKNAPMTISVNYHYSGDIIPQSVAPASTTVGNGSALYDFIDNQMNTSAAFDTILTFISSVAGAAENGKEGVGGAVASVHPNLKFEFNKLSSLIGLTNNLEIYHSGVLVMVIDYLSDYTGKQFRFTSTTGSTHLGTFKNGSVNF